MTTKILFVLACLFLTKPGNALESYDRCNYQVMNSVTAYDMHTIAAMACSAYAELKTEGSVQRYQDSRYFFHKWTVSAIADGYEVSGVCAVELNLEASRDADGDAPVYAKKPPLDILNKLPQGIVDKLVMEQNGAKLSLKITQADFDNATTHKKSISGTLGVKDISISFGSNQFIDRDCGVENLRDLKGINQINIGGNLKSMFDGTTMQPMLIKSATWPQNNGFDSLRAWVQLSSIAGKLRDFVIKGNDHAIFIKNLPSADVAETGPESEYTDSGNHVFVYKPQSKEMAGVSSLVYENLKRGEYNRLSDNADGGLGTPQMLNETDVYPVLRRYFKWARN